MKRISIREKFAGPTMDKPHFDFVQYEKKAQGMSNEELQGAIKDIKQTLAMLAAESRKGVDISKREGWYADELATYAKELNKRENAWVSPEEAMHAEKMKEHNRILAGEPTLESRALESKIDYRKMITKRASVRDGYEQMSSGGQSMNSYRHPYSGEIINLENGTWRVNRQDGEEGSMGNGVDMYRYEDLEKAMEDVDARWDRDQYSLENQFCFECNEPNTICKCEDKQETPDTAEGLLRTPMNPEVKNIKAKVDYSRMITKTAADKPGKGSGRIDEKTTSDGQSHYIWTYTFENPAENRRLPVVSDRICRTKEEAQISLDHFIRTGIVNKSDGSTYHFESQIPAVTNTPAVPRQKIPYEIWIKSKKSDGTIYEKWEKRLDKLISSKYGLGMLDFPDWRSMDCYESNKTVEQGFAAFKSAQKKMGGFDL